LDRADYLPSREGEGVKGFIAVSLSGLFAQATDIDVPGINEVVEKGGVWGIVGLLLYWVLGRFSKQLDALGASIEKLADKLEDKK
jgi:hypothetical protein